ncbi:MAG: UPF0149 family protein [Gammaproteobacteria bacterium]
MYDRIERPNFEALDAELRAVAAALFAAEAHGVLCGLLCADEGIQADFWERQIFGEMEADEAGCPQCRGMIEEIFDWTKRSLNGEELEFEMLLPEEDVPLSERTQALVGWASGFLVGMGLGGFREEANISAEARETLADLEQVARAEIPEDDDEAQEDALIQIVEYIRVAVQLIHEELHPVLRSGHIPERLH